MRYMRYYKRLWPSAQTVLQHRMAGWLDPWSTPEAQSMTATIQSEARKVRDDYLAGLNRAGVSGPMLASVARQTAEEVPTATAEAVMGLKRYFDPSEFLSRQQDLALKAGQLKLDYLNYLRLRDAMEQGGGFDFGGLISGLGGLVGGLGKLGIFSTKEVKKDVEDVSGEDLLKSLRKLPIKTWRYRWEDEAEEKHVGPMAEDYAREMGGPSDTYIPIADLLGKTLAMVKSLDRKLRARRAR